MNPLRAAVRAVSTMLGAAFTVVGSIATRSGQSISLIPQYLANLLWILSAQFVDLANNGFKQNAAVYACLRLLSQSVPEPPLIAHTITQDGELDKPLPWMHPLCQLIRTPNSLTSEYEMWEIATLHLAIVGRTVWFKERDNAGRTIAVWPLRPDRVGPIYSVEQDKDKQVLLGWSYLVPGTTNYIPLARSDTWFVNLADPGGESGGLVEGVGPMQALAAEIGADNEATKFVGALMANYGTPGILLQTKTPIRSVDDAKLIKQAFQREFGGNRRGLPALIDADTTVTQLGFNLQNLEFPQVRSVAESRIAAAFGVPAILAGLKTGLEAGIRATIAEQREYFAETTLANYWRRLSSAYTRDVASEFGDGIACEFDLTRVRALQVQGRYDIEKVAGAFAQGAVTLDEYRQKVLKLPPFGGAYGNSVLVPTTSTPTPTDAAIAVNPYLTGGEGDEVAGDEEAAREAAEQNNQPNTEQPVGKGARQPYRPVMPRPPLNGANGHGNGTTVLSPDQARVWREIGEILAGKAAPVASHARVQATAARRRDEATTAHQPALAAYLKDLGEHAAARIRAPHRLHPTKADTYPAGDLIPADSQQQLTDLLTALWTSVLGDAFADASATLGIGIAYDVTNPAIKQILNYVGARTPGIDGTTRTAIRDLVGEATLNGWTSAQLADKIQSAGAFSASRAETIARTEGGTAYNLGAVEAYTQSGVVDAVTCLDGDYDEICAGLNGTTQTLAWAKDNPIQHVRCTRAFAPIVGSPAEPKVAPPAWTHDLAELRAEVRHLADHPAAPPVLVRKTVERDAEGRIISINERHETVPLNGAR